MTKDKIIIYQVFTRLFGNKSLVCKKWGSVAENGCGKMDFFDSEILGKVKDFGITHIWYTGIIRHASCTNYEAYGIPSQHPSVVKGKAGSPYAITDYYDVDPDLATNVEHRMEEFDALVQRTHAAGLRMIIDFVPNHVARQYHSIAKPADVVDLGGDDDTNMGFSSNNNFYYCVGQKFQPTFDLKGDANSEYTEIPAKATGNDHFDSHPSKNDWYETIKLNYGVDYCDAGGKSLHFDPVPDTWRKMVNILLYWANKGVDAFRCDMAEMVPVEFWEWAIRQVKQEYPHLLFIAEVYNPSLYRNYVNAGFDFLYDKVGMYDTLRSVICGNGRTEYITYAWQQVDDIKEHMLYFLENHDEQRIASDFFAGNGVRALPAVMTSVFMQTNPFMIYAGQEFGEKGMDEEGFSGRDGRTTIFDYWTIPSLYRGFVDTMSQTNDEKCLQSKYKTILRLAHTEKAFAEGAFFDLMYVNPNLSDKQYAFIRKAGNEVLVVVVNYSGNKTTCSVNIPQHAFDFLSIPQEDVQAIELLTGKSVTLQLGQSSSITMEIPPYDGVIYKFMTYSGDNLVLNEHNKDEFPPAHTAEHLLNRTMMQMFGCERSKNAHIERKKSKMTFVLDHKPNRKEEKAIECRMNDLIADDLPVKYEFVDKDHIPEGVDVERLPEDVSETIRLVYIGDYDICPCIGKHVRSTSQIGRFVMLGSNWDETSHSYRIRYKVV